MCASKCMHRECRDNMVTTGGSFFIKIITKRGVMRGGGTPYNGLYGEALPERGTFFRSQVYERVGISQVEVYKRVGKSVI